MTTSVLPSSTTILSAPQGWGKNRNTQALQQELGCSSVVDGWTPSQPLTPGALHLTHLCPQRFSANKPELYRLVQRGWN